VKEWTGEHLRKRWADSAKRRLEDVLNDVVLGLVVVADAKRAERLEQECEEREREEARRKALEAERRRREEEERRRLLEKQAKYWAKAQQLRAFIDEVERRSNVKGVSVALDTELGQWIAWARRHADRLDPLKPPIEEDGDP
jgi:hypothetical protein